MHDDLRTYETLSDEQLGDRFAEAIDAVIAEALVPGADLASARAYLTAKEYAAAMREAARRQPHLARAYAASGGTR